MGRPKKDGERTASGRLSRAAEHVIPREALAQRAAAVGVPLTGARERTMRDQRAGTALGVLRLRSREGLAGLDERQYRAGEALGALWRQWAAMAKAPPRTAVNSDAPPAPDRGADEADEAKRWDRINGTFKRIRNDVWTLHAGVPAWRLIEQIVMDNRIPPALDESHHRLWAAVHEALDRIAGHFKIPRDLAA